VGGQRAGVAGVFAEDDVGAGEGRHGAERQVGEVADGGCDQIEAGG